MRKIRGGANYTSKYGNLSLSTTFLAWRNTPQWAKAYLLSRLHDHTQTHHNQYDSSWRVINPTQRHLPENTKHSQGTDIHACGGIRTRNPSKLAATGTGPLYTMYRLFYRGADKSLARPTSRCILFDGENISFDAILIVYISSTNIPPIMIINRIYETQNLLSL